MSEHLMLSLYEQLEPWALRVAQLVAHKSGLSRWADDILQEARVALWQAIQLYDADKNDDAERYVRWKFQCLLKDALRRYKRWNTRELSFPDHFDV